jgi:UDP-glucose 4-epimerase
VVKLISGKSILIVGGAGFIGWALAKALSDNEVVILDDLSNPCPLFDPKTFEFHNSSVENVSNVFGKRNFDYIFHFGEYSRVETSLSEFKYVFDKNTRQFPNLLEFCKIADAKLIYPGTSSIFSDRKNPELLSPYTMFKKLNCDILKSYAHWYGLEYAICYFSNVYGPGECEDPKYTTVIQKYINLIRNGHKALPVTGDGTQVREFTHIEDTINALFIITELGKGDGYCISSGEKISINEVT